MTRTVFTGGRVFDGTGADPADADIAIEDGRILEVGRGLDADEQVEVSGKAILPGLFDCHTHVMFSHIDFLKAMEEPFSYKFFDAARNQHAGRRVEGDLPRAEQEVPAPHPLSVRSDRFGRVVRADRGSRHGILLEKER